MTAVAALNMGCCNQFAQQAHLDCMSDDAFASKTTLSGNVTLMIF